MKAKSKQHYIDSWSNHVAEFTSILGESGLPVDDWDAFLAPMKHRIDLAADAIEASGEWQVEPPLTCGACTVAIGAHTKQKGCREFAG